MACVHACEKPTASPQEWAERVFQGKQYYSSATDSSKPSTSEDSFIEKCHASQGISTEEPVVGCINEMGRLNTRVPICAQWYYVPKNNEQVDSQTFDADVCIKCAAACSTDASSTVCMSSTCRLGVTLQDSNETPFDYVHAAKMAETFWRVAKRIRDVEEAKDEKKNYRRKIHYHTNPKANVKNPLKRAGLAVDPYGRMLIRKMIMLENVATYVRIKSKSLMTARYLQMVQTEKAMESLRSMQELTMMAKRALIIIEESGTEGKSPAITPDILWVRIQAIYESSSDDPMPMGKLV